MSKNVKIGVLSYQGSVMEHMRALSLLDNVEPLEVKTLSSLQAVDGLILPGGESTTISKLLSIFDLLEPLKERIRSGMPVWGTCAGMILLAETVIGEETHLGLMHITIRRNAFGRQLQSSKQKAAIPKISPEPFDLVLIRAPWIEAVNNDRVEILCEVDGHILAAQEEYMLVTAFHPEVTGDLRIHQYFAHMCGN